MGRLFMEGQRERAIDELRGWWSEKITGYEWMPDEILEKIIQYTEESKKRVLASDCCPINENALSTCGKSFQPLIIQEEEKLVELIESSKCYYLWDNLYFFYRLTNQELYMPGKKLNYEIYGKTIDLKEQWEDLANILSVNGKAYRISLIKSDLYYNRPLRKKNGFYLPLIDLEREKKEMKEEIMRLKFTGYIDITDFELLPDKELNIIYIAFNLFMRNWEKLAYEITNDYWEFLLFTDAEKRRRRYFQY